MDQVVLSEDQLEHFNNVNTNIAQKHSSILDTTLAGGGKTLLALYFGWVRKIKRYLVICNGSIQLDHWTKHKYMYNSPIVDIMTYDTLRGSSVIRTLNGKNMVPHGYLYKNDDGTYEVTETFQNYVEEGLLLIIDECHFAKNDCGKTEALKTLSRYIGIRNMMYPLPMNKSFNYFASMTPFDEMEHVINFGMLCGVIQSNSLYCNITSRPTGIMELYTYCSHFDKTRTDIIWGTTDIKSKNVMEVGYKLMTEVFLRLISSFAKNCQANYISKQSVYFAYFDIDSTGLELMEEALGMIKISVRDKNKIDSSKILELCRGIQNFSITPSAVINGINNTQIPQISYSLEDDGRIINNEIDDKIKNKNRLNQIFANITDNSQPPFIERSGIVHAMTTIQSIKTYFGLINFVRYIFNSVPNSKVTIFADYKESIRIVHKYLAEYKPVKITGDSDCTEEVRNNIVSKFREPNLDVRLLTIISQIGADGIELDSLNENFFHIGIGFPGFYQSRLIQCPGRFLRRFTKSNSLFFWFFVNSDKLVEESVIKSITSKSRVMEETLRNNGIIPPIYYERIENPQNMDLNLLLKNAGSTNKPKTTIEQQFDIPKTVKISRSSIQKKF